MVATGSNINIKKWRYNRKRLSPDFCRRSVTKSIRKKFTRLARASRCIASSVARSLQVFRLAPMIGFLLNDLMGLSQVCYIRRILHSDEKLSIYVASVQHQLCDESISPGFQVRQAPSCHRSPSTMVSRVNFGNVV